MFLVSIFLFWQLMGVICYVDTGIFCCQHNKLQPLTARRGKWIPETLYREIASIVKNDSPKCITPEGGEDLLHQELTNCEIDYDKYHCSDCSQSLCLEIKNKRNLYINFIILSKH